MSQYLDGLPTGATVGYVLSDLHERGKQMVPGFDELGTPSFDGIAQPDTDLAIDWGIRPVAELNKVWASVAARADGGRTPLLSVANFAFGNAVPAGASIEGFRGVEADRPAYVLHSRPTGIIECKVDARGVTGIAPEELAVAGLGQHRASNRVDRLDPAARTRLGIVAEGFLEGVAAVELIQDGASGADIVEMMTERA